jgi:hypothetical protein
MRSEPYLRLMTAISLFKDSSCHLLPQQAQYAWLEKRVGIANRGVTLELDWHLSLWDGIAKCGCSSNKAGPETSSGGIVIARRTWWTGDMSSVPGSMELMVIQSAIPLLLLRSRMA